MYCFGYGDEFYFLCQGDQCEFCICVFFDDGGGYLWMLCVEFDYDVGCFYFFEVGDEGV